MTATKVRYLGVCGPSEQKTCQCGEVLHFRQMRYFVQVNGETVGAGIAWLAPNHRCAGKPQFLERAP